MNPDQIKSATSLSLKPNAYLADPSFPYLYQKKMCLIELMRPRMINGDDVGLGKTLELILAMTYIKAGNQDTKFLVLTESISVKQWAEELEKHAPTLKTKIITVTEYPEPIPRVQAFRGHSADVIVTTYSMMYKYHQHIRHGLGKRWVFIADEPNVFKNTASQIHQVTYDMVNDPETGAARAYGATATILENRLEEAFAIIRMVSPNTFESRAQFERDFCVPQTVKNRKGNRIRVVKKYKNLAKFRQQIDPVFFGRLQDDPEVKQALPEVITKDVPIVLSRIQSEKVLEATDKILQMPDGTIQMLDVLPSLTRSQQLADDPSLLGFNIKSAKLEALLETLNNSLAGERVVIFSKFRSMVDKIQQALEKQGQETVRITGAESKEQKERSKDRFMSDGPDRCNILLITRAGQKAANLQKGGHLFFYDMPWSYGIYRQTIGRLKRTGSTHKAIGVYRLLACLHPDIAALVGSDHTIDHHSRDVVLKKFKLWQAITGDVEEIESSTSDALEIFDAIRKKAA